MKIDWIKSVITLFLSALLAYAFYTICDVEELKWLLTVAAFVTISVTGMCSIGLSLNAERTGIMFKAFSGIFLALFIVLNLIFSFIDFNIPFYVILNGILILIYALASVSMCRIKQ